MADLPQPVWVNRKKIFWVVFLAVFLPMALGWSVTFGPTVFDWVSESLSPPPPVPAPPPGFVPENPWALQNETRLIEYRRENALPTLALTLVGSVVIALFVLGLVLGVLYWRHILQFLGRWFTT